MGESHEFRIKRVGGETWRWIIDGDIKGSTTWVDQGALLQTGLESYDSGAVVESYQHKELKYELNQGSWSAWSGYDSSYVDLPKMCGGWNSPSSWRLSENSPC